MLDDIRTDLFLSMKLAEIFESTGLAFQYVNDRKHKRGALIHKGNMVYNAGSNNRLLEKLVDNNSELNLKIRDIAVYSTAKM